MTRPAAKRKALWPALLATVAVLLAGAAEASLPSSASHAELLAKPALTAALANAEQAEKPRVHTRSFALFPPPTPPRLEVEAQKLASGVKTWEPALNIRRVRYFASISWQRTSFDHRARFYDPSTQTFLEPDPLGPIDSPNLYQAFSLDGFNVTDPFGECLFGIGGTCAEWANKAAGVLNQAKGYVREHTGGGALGVGADYAVSNVLDIAEMVAVDPFRVGDATGQAVGEGAGVGTTALAVVQDVGRAATLAAGAGTLAKAGGRAAKAIRAATKVDEAAAAGNEVAPGLKNLGKADFGEAGLPANEVAPGFKGVAPESAVPSAPNQAL